MSQYIIPLPHNDPRLFSHVSQAFSLVDLGKRLLEAAKNGDVEEVKSLISHGAPFTTDWLGISPLHFAAMNGHLSSCEELLEAGISRDARTKVERTPLHLAAQEGHADIVELLLRKGADLCANDMLHMTALHWAAERGHSPVVQMLMRFGANAHIQNKFEMTPLDIAKNKGHQDAMDAMLNTQYDAMSSVGRMAATNGDLMHANAYILTDEETLVPAAPPADEVTVTATNVEDCESNNECSGQNEKTGSNLNVLSEDKSTWSNICTNYKNSNVNEIDHDVNYINQDNADNKPVCTDTKASSMEDLILTDENGPMDMIIVETPGGETLYVRPQPTTENANNLVIFNSLGQPVHNPELMSQVMEALISLPESDTTLNTSELETSNCKSNMFDFKMKTEHETFTPTFLATADNLNSSNLVSDDPNEKTDQPMDDPNSLVAQLALFASQVDVDKSNICVEGVGLFTSKHDLIMWCLCNGLYAKGYTDDNPTLKVEFSYQGESYTLTALYDSELGTISFYPVVAESLKCEF